MIVLRRSNGVPAGIVSALQVCGVLRQAIMSRCPQQPPPEWISGHSADGGPSLREHLAIVPLADVGHRYARGHLMGLGVVVPPSVPDSQRRSLLERVLAPDGDEGLRLWGGTDGWFEWDVEVEDAPVPPRALDAETWAGGRGCRIWASVTPMVLDRHARSATGLADSIRSSCRRLGLPEPSRVALGDHSPIVGVPPAWRFPPLRRRDGSSRRHLHTVIEFATPIVGPLILGAGRFVGYGLFRPVSAFAPHGFAVDGVAGTDSSEGHGGDT
jgi:CRISPR-associated protein Csb2